MKKIVFGKIALMSLVGLALLEPQALLATSPSQPNAAATQDLKMQLIHGALALVNSIYPAVDAALNLIKADVENGADINLDTTGSGMTGTGKGITALCLAIGRKNLDLVKFFTAKGANVNQPCCFGSLNCFSSPLALANSKMVSDPAIIDFLKQSGAH